MSNNKINIRVNPKIINSKYRHLIKDYTTRFIVLYGGAGSGKSFFIAQRIIWKLLDCKMCNVLVVRAFANSNRDSTFALLRQVINQWQLSKYFKTNESDLRITCLLNNNSIVFKGLDDTEKLKSITFAKGDLTDIWIEEASEIKEEDFNQLNIRLRGAGPTKQMILSFNPVDINSWLKAFTERKDVYVLKTTYKDNEFLDEAYKQELEKFKETDPYYYNVYCLGEWGVYGDSVFDKNKIAERLKNIPGAIKTGLFDEQGNFIEAAEGYITIYKDVEQGKPYVIGGDTAGEGSDYFIGQVLDNTTGEQVAVLRNQMDADLYASQMYYLGKYYNEALIGIEANYDSYPIKVLEQKGYTKQFIREREDTFTGKIVKAYGFKTTNITRPVIISELVQIVREHTELFNDRGTLEEMLTFIRNEKGRAEAKNGAHDDLVMAIAIAYYIRTQQSIEIVKPKEEDEIEANDNWEEDFINYGV